MKPDKHPIATLLVIAGGILVLIVLTVLMLSEVRGQQKMVKVSKQEGVQLVEQRIAQTQATLNELTGMRNGFILADADSVNVPEGWTR